MKPHDITDLRFAPVVLELDSRLEELGGLDEAALVERVALVGDLPDWPEAVRSEALLRVVGHLIDLHGWELSWDARGLRVSHSSHHVTLGVPASLHQYVVAGH